MTCPTHLNRRVITRMNWSDLNPKQKAQIEKYYREGKEPGDIADNYGLKPKQISDQAYRKKWSKPNRASKSAAIKNPAAKKKAAGKKTAAKKKSPKKKS